MDPKQKNKLLNDRGVLFICNDLVFNPETKELPKQIDAMIEGAHGKKTLANGKVKDVVISASDIDAAVSYVQRRRQREPNREFVIDYDHGTIYGGDTRAAGWYNDLKKIERQGKAVAQAVISKWTPLGAERILNGEYRFTSPVFVQNVIDPATSQYEQCMIFNIGLTNEPFLQNMMPVAASQLFNNTIIGDTQMDELLSWLRSFLSLPLASTAEEILAELTKLSDKIKAGIDAGTVTAKTVLDYMGENKPADIIAGRNSLTFQGKVIASLGLEANASPEQALALLVTAKANSDKLSTVSQELQSLKQANLQRDFDVVIAKAIQRGAILPVQKNDTKWMDAQKAWAEKNFSEFETYFCSGAPVIGPVGPLPNTDSASQGTGLSDLDKEVARMSGIDEKIVAKHNPAQQQ